MRFDIGRILMNLNGLALFYLKLIAATRSAFIGRFETEVFPLKVVSISGEPKPLEEAEGLKWHCVEVSEWSSHIVTSDSRDWFCSENIDLKRVVM
jgi:hypothetical protein